MKVLFIRLSSLGDVVLTTPALAALKGAQQKTEVDFLVKKEFAPILSGNPHINEIIPVDTRGAHRGAVGLFHLAAELRRKGYTHIIDLHGNPRSRLISALLPGAATLRYKKQAFKRRLMLFGLKPKTKQVVDVYLDTLSDLGINGGKRTPKIFLSPEEKAAAKQFLAAGGLGTGGPLIGLNPGAKWPTKRWPAERFAELGKGLTSEKGCRIVIFGGREDEEAAETIRRAIGPAALSAAGKLGLKESAALMAECSLFITNDSGPMHMATAVGVPVIALFGPTVRGFGFSPLGNSVVVERDLSCRPCTLHGGPACPKGHFDCMKGIDSDAVFEITDKVLKDHLRN